MTPPKTLHITNSYHPASGGIRTFYQALLQGANRHRRLLRLVVPGPETSVEDVSEFGRIYYVRAPHVPVLDSRYRWMLPHTYAWRYDSPLRRILAAERADLVEVCDKFWLLYLSGVLRREWIPRVPVPVIVGLTCERLDNNMAAYVSAGPFAHFACRRYMRWCYAPRFDFHIAVSDYVAEEVSRVLPERLHGRLHVSPMGVDTEVFERSKPSGPLRARLLQQTGGGDRSLLLLYAGRLSKEKNLSMLPNVLANLAAHSTHDYRLIVAGDGPFAKDFRVSLEQLAPGRFLFLGHYRREDLPELYHAADVFLHPNPREPFGLAPLEAMAAGLPLVAQPSGGLLTYANSTNAWLAKDTSADAFAAAVRNVHSDEAIRLSRIAEARRTAQQFSWTRIIDAYFHLYDSFHAQFLRETFAVPGDTVRRNGDGTHSVS